MELGQLSELQSDSRFQHLGFKLCLCERPILHVMCISGGQESTQLSGPLLLLPLLCENALTLPQGSKVLKF